MNVEKEKFIIVSVFVLLGLLSVTTTTILNPRSVQAKFDVSSVYESFMRLGGEEVSLRSWGKNIVLGTGTDVALCVICGCENDKEKIWAEGNAEACVPPLDEYQAALSGENPRYIGGFGR